MMKICFKICKMLDKLIWIKKIIYIIRYKNIIVIMIILNIYQNEQSVDHEEHDAGDIFVHQVIETIEFVLGYLFI